MLKNWLNQFVKRPVSLVASIVIAFAGLTGLPYPSQAQNTPRPSPTAPASPKALLASQVAQTIAGYTQGDPNAVKRIISSLSSVQIPYPADFNDLSPVSQLRWAYSAVDAHAQGAGEEMVAAFTKVVSRDTPSILSEPIVKALVQKYPSPRNSFDFVVQAPGASVASPLPEVDQVIARVTDIACSRGSGMSAFDIMRNRLKLSEDDVLLAIQEHGSGRAALENKLANLPDPPQKKELAELALELMKAVPASRSDPVIGEAVFRWLALDDPTVGEWSRYRDDAIERVQQGRMRIPEKKQADAIQVATKMRKDFARMPALFLNRNSDLRPKDIERMFYEYTKRSPDVAALWGFVVIGLKEDFAFEPYVPEAAAHLHDEFIDSMTQDARKGLTKKFGRELTNEEKLEVRAIMEEQYGKIKDWAQIVREHGPKPHDGYVEYARLNGFDAGDAAKVFSTSPPFQEWVGKLCPNT